MSNFVISGVTKQDTTDDKIPENFVFNVELIIRDYKGIDQSTDSRKELAEAIRLVCEAVLDGS